MRLPSVRYPDGTEISPQIELHRRLGLYAGVRPVFRLPDADLARLRALIAEMDAALANDDRIAWADVDDRFHALLVVLAGNRRLEQLVSTFSDQVRRARLLTLFIRPRPDGSNADHRALVEAIAEGDAERARSIHRDHRMRAKNLMLGLLERHGFHTV